MKILSLARRRAVTICALALTLTACGGGGSGGHDKSTPSAHGQHASTASQASSHRGGAASAGTSAGSIPAAGRASTPPAGGGSAPSTGGGSGSPGSGGVSGSASGGGAQSAASDAAQHLNAHSSVEQHASQQQPGNDDSPYVGAYRMGELDWPQPSFVRIPRGPSVSFVAFTVDRKDVISGIAIANQRNKDPVPLTFSGRREADETETALVLLNQTGTDVGEIRLNFVPGGGDDRVRVDVISPSGDLAERVTAVKMAAVELPQAQASINVREFSLKTQVADEYGTYRFSTPLTIRPHSKDPGTWIVSGQGKFREFGKATWATVKLTLGLRRTPIDGLYYAGIKMNTEKAGSAPHTVELADLKPRAFIWEDSGDHQLHLLVTGKTPSQELIFDGVVQRAAGGH